MKNIWTSFDQLLKQRYLMNGHFAALQLDLHNSIWAYKAFKMALG